MTPVTQAECYMHRVRLGMLHAIVIGLEVLILWRVLA